MALEEDLRQQALTEYTNSSSEKKSKKFNFSVLSYPSDLGSDDLQHFVTFRINIRGKSKFDQDKIVSEVRRDPDSAGFTSESISTAATTATQIAAGVIGFGIAKNFLSRNVKTGGQSSFLQRARRAVVDTTVSAAAGVATGAVAGEVLNANKLLKPDTTYRISDVIALYMDGPPTVRYNANYSMKELGTLAGIAAGGVSGVASVANPMSEQAAAVGLQFAALPGALGATDLKSLIGASAKVALNPFKEVLFESIDFRTFQFRYRFFPKSLKESNEVFEIIKKFKFHMHPELSDDKLFFIYPSEFVIEYNFVNKQNTYFHKLKPCALESMDVTYGGQDNFAAFKNGYPAEINLSLTFKELEILTKQSIEQGF